MQKNLTVILELRNTLSEIKKSVAGFYSQLNTAKHRISELEEISRKHPNWSKKKKNKINMRHAGINSQWHYSWKEKNEEDAIFSEKTVKNIPKLI